MKENINFEEESAIIIYNNTKENIKKYIEVLPRCNGIGVSLEVR